MKPITFINTFEREEFNYFGWDKMVLYHITESAPPKKKKDGTLEWFKTFYFVCDDEYAHECGYSEYCDMMECYRVDPNWNKTPDIQDQLNIITKQLNLLTK